MRLKGHLEPTSVGPKWEHFSLEIDMTELKAEGFQGELGRGRIQQIWITPTAADMTKITLSVKRLRSGVGELDRFVDEVKAAQKPCP